MVIAIDNLNHANADPMLSMIFFLTDGRPSMSVLDDNAILDGIEYWNRKQYSIHTVAFGRMAKYDLLRQISQRNKGVARKLYHLSETTAQLKGRALCKFLPL